MTGSISSPNRSMISRKRIRTTRIASIKNSIKKDYKMPGSKDWYRNYRPK
jgi:hypothetical protein